MKTPLILARERFITAFGQLVAGSELPACVLADVLSICLTEIKSSAREEYENALRDYQQAMDVEAQEIAEKATEAAEEPAE